MAAATWTMACVLLAANAGPTDTFFIHTRKFQIPIGIKENRRANIRQVTLSQREPDGKTWRPIGSVTADNPGFTYTAAADGPAYFKLTVVDTQGQLEDIGERCIVVDSVPPVLALRSAERQGDDVSVGWTLDEQNPDYATLKLEYAASDAPTAPWTEVPVPTPESGRARFAVVGPAARVRLSVMDLAKNKSDVVELPIKNGGGLEAAAGGPGGGGLPALSGTGETAPAPLPPPLTANGGGWSPQPPGGAVPTALVKPAGRATADGPDPARPAIVAAAGNDAAPGATGGAPPRPARGPLPPVKMLKKRQITIDYEVTKFGPSGIKSVKLYVTRDDGRTWQLCGGEDNVNVPLPTDGQVPAALKRSLSVDLQADGLYGFFLVVESGAGISKPPPQNGIDPPQIRVEVDTTAPKADLFEPKPHPTRRDSLLLTWSASDNKLGPTPVTLQWAERPDGEWHIIGGGELANTGEYVWQVPGNVPPRVYLRLLVRDLAGNESVAQTAESWLVDLSEPEVKPLQISAGPR